MTDSSPRFDDRRFQDLVDQAKRMIPALCPEWTNHGPGDPGIALIEVFAWMTDVLIDRVNGLAERAHESFVEFLGVQPLPSAAAVVDVAFLTADRLDTDLLIPRGTTVGTTAHDASPGGVGAVTFETIADVRVVAPRVVAVGTLSAAGEYVERSGELERLTSVAAFPSLTPGDAMVIGLAEPAERAVLSIDISCSVAGIGVSPSRPPITWEAWNGEHWEPVEVPNDSTGGLQRDGAVEVTMPSRHVPMRLGTHAAHWVRCRLGDVALDQPTYVAAPEVTRVAVHAVGAVATASHCSTKGRELLGISDGTPGQEFRTSQSPVLPRQPGEVVVVEALGEASEWQEVEDFTRSGPDDRHYTFDSATGAIRFGPRVVEADGSRRQYGAVVADGADVAISAYRVGGGVAGNVGAMTIATLRTSIPNVAYVRNSRPALGGVDPESPEDWRNRARLWLQTGQRAVTREDYERLALWARPEVARTVCTETSSPRSVYLGIVPSMSAHAPTIDDVAVPREVTRAVCDAIEVRRTVGTSVTVGAPRYQGVSVVARVRSSGLHEPRLDERCVAALTELLHPLRGGPRRDGWPFGRDVDAFSLATALGVVRGVDEVTEVRLFEADLQTGAVGEPTNRVRIGPGALPLLVRPMVRVTQGEEDLDDVANG